MWQYFKLYSFLIVSALVFVGQSAQAAQHKMASGDLIDISVMSRPDLSRAHMIQSDGAISLHILGRIRVAGRTPAELEEILKEKFSSIFQGSTSVTVQVVRYRPVIVAGQVAVPGAYDFAPSLDVAAAVALAGGVRGATSDDNVASQMRVEAEIARYAMLRARLANRLVERARLIAERDESFAISMPAEAESVLGDAATDIMGLQTTLRSVRDEQLSLRIAFEESRRDLAREEAAAYADRRDLIRGQIAATMDQLEVQQDLAARGLAVSQRLLELRLMGDRLRGDELEAVGLEAAARQKIYEAEAGLKSAATQRSGELAQTISAITAEIAEIRVDIDLARRFVTMFGDLNTKSVIAGVETTYRIRRRNSDGVTVIQAEPDTSLLPGDMVEVLLEDPILLSFGPD